MSEHETNSRDVIKIFAPLLAMVCLILIIAAVFTDLGQMKNFRFLIGFMAMLTTITYAFQAALKVSVFAPFGVFIWGSITLMSFTQALWLVAK